MVLLGLGLPALPVDAEFITWPWELMARNADAISSDLAGASGASMRGTVHKLACLEQPERIVIEEGAVIGAVRRARRARRTDPRRSRRAHRAAHARARAVRRGRRHAAARRRDRAAARSGPSAASRARSRTCIWQGYANKRHHGFVGHSVIGEWVNLGALTTTSDLKNNYGNGASVGGRPRARQRFDQGRLVRRRARQDRHRHAAAHRRERRHGREPVRRRPVRAQARARRSAGGTASAMAEHELEKFLATARIRDEPARRDAHARRGGRRCARCFAATRAERARLCAATRGARA